MVILNGELPGDIGGTNSRAPEFRMLATPGIRIQPRDWARVLRQYIVLHVDCMAENAAQRSVLGGKKSRSEVFGMTADVSC